MEIKDDTNGITVARNVIAENASHAISLTAKSSAQVSFNTIVGNGGAGVIATGTGSWVQVRNNILDGNATGLKAVSGALVRNDYNLLHNTANLSGVTAGANTLTVDPAFAPSGYYVPSVSLARARCGRPAGRGAGGRRHAGRPGIQGADRVSADAGLRT